MLERDYINIPLHSINIKQHLVTGFFNSLKWILAVIWDDTLVFDILKKHLITKIKRDCFKVRRCDIIKKPDCIWKDEDYSPFLISIGTLKVGKKSGQYMDERIRRVIFSLGQKHGWVFGGRQR